MPRDFTVIAIISAYNEGDVIGQTVGDLIDHGIGVYLLDHGSTDDTVAEVTPYLGKGLLRIEALPAAAPGEAGRTDEFAWASVLRRKEALTRELDASWFIHHDADEFRESPWAHLGLREAIEKVDALDYNAIDFELLNFWPTHDDFRPGQDVRRAFTFYDPPQPWDKVQVKCWKNVAGPVDLVSSGGHDVSFDGRRVFPLRFILRHYPVRGQGHGERKVFRERRPRFAAERARGWHCQYDSIQEGGRFIRDPATLTAYDAEAVRLQLVLRHRGVEELERTVAAQQAQIEETRRALAEVTRVRSEELEAHRRGLEELAQAVVGQQRMLEDSQRALAALRGEVEALQQIRHQELDAHRREVEELARRQGEERETHRRALEDLARVHNAEREEHHRALVDLGRAHGAERAEHRRALEDLDRAHGAERDEHRRALEELQGTVTAQQGWLEESRRATAEVAALHEAMAELRRAATAREEEALRVAASLRAAQHRLDALYTSRSWRWMAPLRLLQRLLVGR
jgi:hypothetical protein